MVRIHLSIHFGMIGSLLMNSNVSWTPSSTSPLTGWGTSTWWCQGQRHLWHTWTNWSTTMMLSESALEEILLRTLHHCKMPTTTNLYTWTTASGLLQLQVRPLKLVLWNWVGTVLAFRLSYSAVLLCFVLLRNNFNSDSIFRDWNFRSTWIYSRFKFDTPKLL